MPKLINLLRGLRARSLDTLINLPKRINLSKLINVLYGAAGALL